MIAATDILIEDDTAWYVPIQDSVVGTLNVKHIELKDRSCEVCDGEPIHMDTGAECGACDGSGRHTFEIEVDCRECGGSGEHDTGQGCWACQSCDGPLRVSVVEMLPIVEWDGQPEGIACLDTLGNVWYPDIDREGEPVHYLKDHAVLPESAAPGQCAVRLKIGEQ